MRLLLNYKCPYLAVFLAKYGGLALSVTDSRLFLMIVRLSMLRDSPCFETWGKGHCHIVQADDSVFASFS